MSTAEGIANGIRFNSVRSLERPVQLVPVSDGSPHLAVGRGDGGRGGIGI